MDEIDDDIGVGSMAGPEHIRCGQELAKLLGECFKAEKERDEARAEVEGFREAIGKLRRGCDCEHDYRCRQCAAIVSAWGLVKPTESAPE